MYHFPVANLVLQRQTSTVVTCNRVVPFNLQKHIFKTVLLQCIAKDMMSLLLSKHKRNDFNTVNFRHHSK